jgi:REP element-mobilizing transposase RayT
MRNRDNEPPLAEPIAYFITWSTYGTWLPGNKRGWVEYRHGWQLPDAVRKLEAAARMSEDACVLNEKQRLAVHEQIAETCDHRGWTLHAVNCRSNHLHVVVTAPVHPKVVRSQLKAWCTRKLKEQAAAERHPDDVSKVRDNWWAERGSQRYVNDEESLESAILYVRDGQDKRYRSKA